VSKSVLYRAFQKVCGEPPLVDFRKRRLMQAPTILLNTVPERSAVKCVALDVALTEFGRFSVEYRRLIKEYPSGTLE